MSGIEMVAVSGLISSVIGIIEATRDLYDAASSVDGPDKAFWAVSQNVPLVLNILHDCREVQEQIVTEYSLTTDAGRKRDIEESSKIVEPLMLACQENAKQLQEIFQKVILDNDASWDKRYQKAVHAVVPGRNRKVEDLMKEILENLQLLRTSPSFKSESEQKSKELETAINQLSELPSSLPEDDGRYTHHGSGSQFNSPGRGMQHNYNQSGASNSKIDGESSLNFNEDFSYGSSRY